MHALRNFAEKPKSKQQDDAILYNGIPGFASTAHPIFFENVSVGRFAEDSKLIEENIAVVRFAEAFQAGTRCPICLNGSSQDNVRISSCGHVFCCKCFLQWARISRTCALCKAPFQLRWTDNDGAADYGFCSDTHELIVNKLSLTESG